MQRLSICVLIDTWWNVNTNKIPDEPTQDESFNRYMVECELGRFSIEVPADIRFNRYMVECEYI